VQDNASDAMDGYAMAWKKLSTPIRAIRLAHPM
jgi:hypothetical protein